MREIKFRAWFKGSEDPLGGVYEDYEKPQMIKNIQNIYDGHSNEDDPHMVVGWACNMMDLVNDDRFEMMQYTGLTDKNGQEVYEGDIINCTSGCPHEVIYLQEYGGTYFGGMPAFYLSGIKEGYAWSGDEEIIGNIHENPELLEATK